MNTDNMSDGPFPPVPTNEAPPPPSPAIPPTEDMTGERATTDGFPPSGWDGRD